MKTTERKYIHLAGNIKSGGVATFVKNFCDRSLDKNSTHEVLVISNTQNEQINLGNRDLKIIRALPRLNNMPAVLKVLNGSDILVFHTFSPFYVVLLFIFWFKRILLFQHGMALNENKKLKKAGRIFILSSVIKLFPRLKVVCSTNYALSKTTSRGIAIPSRKTDIIPFGLPVGFAKKKNGAQDLMQKSSEHITLGTAGRLVEIKRFDKLLKVLKTYTGSVKMKLLIAGDGPEKPELMNLAAQLNPKLVEVNFLGRINDMERFYSELDCFVFPGHNESLGLVIFEALATGVPTLVMEDLGGALELVGSEYLLIMKDFEELLSVLNDNNNFYESLTEKKSKLIDLKIPDIRDTREMIENIKF